MRQDALHRGDLQLHSVLSGQFISYANLVRLNLEAAARLGKGGRADNAPTPFEIAAEIDAAKANPGLDQEEAEKNGPNAFRGQRQGGDGQGSEDREPRSEDEA